MPLTLVRSLVLATHPTHICCFCLFFLDKECIYSISERLYDHINPETFQMHAPASTQQARVNQTRKPVHAVTWPVSIHIKVQNKLCACNVVVS